MPQVQMWKTPDGEIFETQKEHDDHMSFLQDQDLVEDFLNLREWKSAAVRTKARNVIMDFLNWRNRDEPKQPKEAAAA